MLKLMAALTGLALAAPAHADPIDDIVTEQMRVSHLPGVAVAVVDHGKVTKLKGYGSANLEWPAKVGPDTRFQIASATKLFTAILLMRAVEQGKLSLDDPIGKYLAGGPDTWSRIKVRQLANHTSGLSESLGDPRPRTVSEAVAASMKLPLAYETGTEARYGFTDFTILRAVLEKVGGASLPELIDRELSKPLGLTSTGFAMAEDDGTVRTGELLKGRASVYGWTGDRQKTSDFFFAPLGYGAGGLYASARDLAALFAAIDQGRVLKPESLRILATPAELPNGQKAGFGIGWIVRNYRGTAVVGHSGGPALADVMRMPDRGKTVIVLSNQQVFFPILAERIADLDLPLKPLTLSDDRPAIAANLQGLFADLHEGGEGKAFLAAGSGAAEPLRNGFGRALVEAVGKPSTVQLAEVRADGSRLYRIRFERKVMHWQVEADDAGRIKAMRPA